MVEARALEANRRVLDAEQAGTRSTAPGGDLPLVRGRFFGRETVVRDVISLAHAHRVVTVIGSAGTGKTQTALQAAVRLRESGNLDVRYAGLSGIGDPALVPGAIASAVGLKSATGKPFVLVVDDCEQVAAAVAESLSAILAGTPGVRVLAANREPLGIAGEQIYRLPPLTLPQAAAFFTDRGASSNRGFDASGGREAIVRICGRLDGIPGAIELAAARADTLPLETIACSLDERFSCIGVAGATRRRTMHTMLEWSYDLLNDPERVLFRRLGVFAGAFGVEAVERVCGDGFDTRELHAALSVLAHMALVTSEPKPDRYRLLHPARDYAAELLAESGERDRLAAACARHFCDRARAVQRRYESGPATQTISVIGADLGNYRAVLHWSLVDGNDVAAGSALAAALDPYWHRGEAGVEGSFWIERALALVDANAQPAIASRLWNACALLANDEARYEAARRALSLAEKAGDAACEAWALIFVAADLHRTGRDDEALQAYSRSLETMRALGIRRGIAAALAGEAAILLGRANREAARERLTEAFHETNALEDDAGAVRGDLAELEFAEGDPKRALALAKEASDADHARRCVYRLALGQLEFARTDARKALQRALHDRDDLAIAIVLQHFALIEALIGETRTSARLRGYVDGRYGELGYRRGLTEEWSYQRLIETLQSRLSVSEIVSLAAQGAAWNERRAILEATHA